MRAGSWQDRLAARGKLSSLPRPVPAHADESKRRGSQRPLAAARAALRARAFSARCSNRLRGAAAVRCAAVQVDENGPPAVFATAGPEATGRSTAAAGTGTDFATGAAGATGAS